MKLIYYAYFLRHTMAFLSLGTQTALSTMLGGHFKEPITNKKHKCEKCGIYHGKDICLQYENWNKKVECHHIWSQLGRCMIGNSIFFAVLHMYILQSMNDYKSSLSTDFGITNKFQQVGEITNRTHTHSLSHGLSFLKK